MHFLRTLPYAAVALSLVVLGCGESDETVQEEWEATPTVSPSGPMNSTAAPTAISAGSIHRQQNLVGRNEASAGHLCARQAVAGATAVDNQLDIGEVCPAKNLSK